MERAPDPRRYIVVGAFLVSPFVIVSAIFAYKHWTDSSPPRSSCVAQADHRIALHREGELPSIAAGIAATRDNMIQTCERYWSRAYVNCLIEAPTLVAVDECEKVGRVR